MLAHEFEISRGVLEEPELSFGSADIAGQDEPIHGNLAGSAFDLERLGERDFLGAADVNRMPLVDCGCCYIENPLLAGRASASRLLRNHRERSKLVHQAELALGLAAFSNF